MSVSGSCAAQRVLDVYSGQHHLYVVLGLLDKMLGWQRAGGEGIRRQSTVFWCFYHGGQFSSAAARHRPLGVVGTAVLNPVYRLLIIIVFNCQAGTPGENRFGLIQNWNLKTNLLAGCLTHPALSLC